MGIVGTIIFVIIALIIIAASGGYVVSMYNSLIQVRNNIDKAWKNIDVILLQRHDELIKLLEAVKGYMKHEWDLQVRLTKLRVGYDETDDIEEKTKLENQINREMLKAGRVWEGYPDLKASADFIQLQENFRAGVPDSRPARVFQRHRKHL